MIRVLHSIARMDCGGIETKLMNIYKNINRDAIQFDFLTYKDGKGFYDDEIYALGGRIYHVTPRRKSIIKNKLDTMRFFHENPQYSIVHAHLSSLSNIEVLIAATKCNVKTRIAHSRNTCEGKGIYHYVLHLINRTRIDKFITHKFAISDIAGRWLFGSTADFMTLKNSLDCRQYIYNQTIRNDVRKKLGIDNSFVIGHIGRFHPQKNHEFIIDIFHEIYKKNNNSILLLIGDGSLRLKIEDKVRLLGLTKQVIFLGVRSDIPELLQALDIFLFPSLFEGFGNVLAEAQAAGLKCISSDRPPKSTELTDLIEFLPLELAPEQWASRILKYENGYERRDTSKEIISKGFDNSENIKWLENFYLERGLTI